MGLHEQVAKVDENGGKSVVVEPSPNLDSQRRHGDSESEFPIKPQVIEIDSRWEIE